MFTIPSGIRRTIQESQGELSSIENVLRVRTIWDSVQLPIPRVGTLPRCAESITELATLCEIIGHEAVISEPSPFKFRITVKWTGHKLTPL